MAGKENTLQEFGKYVSQSVLSQLGVSCYILADTYFISKGVGADGLTALNLAIPVFSVMNGCGFMLGIGSGTKYGIMKGTGNEKRGDVLFTSSLCVVTVLAVIFMLIGLLAADPITVLVGANAEVYDMTRTYLQVILLFSPMFMINNLLGAMIRNDGNTSLAMTAMLSGCLFNIVFDYIFVFPMGLGLFGAVLATAVAPIISILILLQHFVKKKNQFRLIRVRPDVRLVASAAGLGVPSLVTEVSSGLVIAVFNLLILGLAGNVGVAAYGVVANISIVVIAIYNGIAQGVQPLLSREYGRSQEKNVHRFLSWAMMLTIILAVVIYGGIYWNADGIAMIFNSGRDMDLQRIAVEGLKIYFTACPFVGANILLAIYFAATDQAAPAQMISLLRGLIVIIPLAFIMANVAGLTGVWMTFPLTELVVCVVACGLYKKMKKLI
ncbi:MAG: MATE family efflux transporter [Lachnospiraceae bacterium]|nr:MATE family efflux transporter [Lachnospiraceae bacterium]